MLITAVEPVGGRLFTLIVKLPVGAKNEMPGEAWRDLRRREVGKLQGEEEAQSRCKAILEMIAPGRVKYSVSGRVYYIELPNGGAAWWVYLILCDDDSIEVRIYPGNTVGQARRFFEKVRKQEFLGLESKGWELRRYLVFCFIGTEVYRAKAKELSLEQYFDYWASEEIKQIRREDNGFEELSQRLRANRVINPNDQRNIKKEFIETKRDFMNVCPGFELIFAWSRAEANRLDRDQRFIEAVRARVSEALRTWGETL